MGSWDIINKEYNMTNADWNEWKRTKKQYRGGAFFTCQKCGRRFYTSPFITFLIIKGKEKPICCVCKESCKEK